MSLAISDLRHAVRAVVRSRGVAAIAIFTLALGTGATTAVFTVVNAVLLRPLPYPASDRIVAVWEINDRGNYARLADANFSDFRDRTRSLSAIAKYAAGTVAVTGAGEPTREVMARVSRQFFDVLRVRPSLGRSFTADDARLGAAPVIVVSHGFWTGALGSISSLETVRLRIQGRVYQVVGVMPPGFQFPARADLWVPSELDADRPSRTAHNWLAIARLHDGSSVAQAAAEISALAKDIVRQSSEQGSYLMKDATVQPLQVALTGRSEPTLYLLLGAVFFLLLVACANVANLLLAHAAARQREIAIRHALGAGPARLIRQFVAEAVVLLAASASAGLLVAWLGTKVLISLAPANLPRLDEVAIDPVVVGFAISLAAVMAITLGLVTAVRATRRDPRAILGDARGQAGVAASAGRLIVVSQVAVTIVLLVGAALLGRSLQRALGVDNGFRTDGLIAMDLVAPPTADPAATARLPLFYADVFARLQAIPGVEDVAATTGVPMDGGLPDGLFAEIDPRDAPSTMDELRELFQQKEKLGAADFCAVTPAYFHALGIPLRRGRLFDDREVQSSQHVAVISESLARARWAAADPIGRTIEFGNMDGDLRPLTIVGVVGDLRINGPEQLPNPTVYVNLMQRPRAFATVVIRTRAAESQTIRAARDVLRQVAPDVPPRFRTFEQIHATLLAGRYFNLTLVAAFAGTALILAVAGIYGVTAYTVNRRRREIGVRIALGATAGDVQRMILGQGLAMTGVGVAVGVAGALALTRTIERLLFGVTPTDPPTFAAAIAVLATSAVLACYVPARRATRADPAEVLRQE